MKMLNYGTRDMAIYAAADLAKALQTPRPESPFQVGDAQLKVIRELAQIFDADTKIPNRYTLPHHPDSLMKKRTTLPRVEYQTAPPPRVDPDEESKNRETKLPSQIQAAPASEATMKIYTKKSKELVKQRRQDHYTENKYDIGEESVHSA